MYLLSNSRCVQVMVAVAAAESSGKTACAVYFKGMKAYLLISVFRFTVIIGVSPLRYLSDMRIIPGNFLWRAHWILWCKLVVVLVSSEKALARLMGEFVGNPVRSSVLSLFFIISFDINRLMFNRPEWVIHYERKIFVISSLKYSISEDLSRHKEIKKKEKTCQVRIHESFASGKLDYDKEVFTNNNLKDRAFSGGTVGVLLGLDRHHW